MKSSGVFNWAVRVKQEPRDGLLTESDYRTNDETTDTKNVQYFKFLQNNPIQILEKNHESVLNEDVDIIFECKDVKPDMRLLAVEKIDDYSPNQFRSMKHGDDFKTQPLIKTEIVSEVKKEIFDDHAEESNLNSDSESGIQNKKRRIMRKSNYERRLNTQVDTVHSNSIHTCDKCDKTFKHKGTLKNHIDSVHANITHAFSGLGNLRMHVEAAHKGITWTYACNRCEKTYKQKNNLKRHVEASHSNIFYACNKCEKTFKRKDSLKMHIEMVHNGITHACDICGKKYSDKSNLKRHMNSVHYKITHTCYTCGKTFSQKSQLIRHINSVHHSLVTT